MEKELPRIDAVTVGGPATLRVRWRGKRAADVVNLSGWIATGGDLLAPLRDPAVFACATVANYGSAVGWDDGDLAIDALHLKKLADEQKPFSNNDVRVWQTFTKLSNSEAAELLGVSVSTWNSYKTSATIPRVVAITLRAALRDPLVVQAHLRPRTVGRPRKAVGEDNSRGARDRLVANWKLGTMTTRRSGGSREALALTRHMGWGIKALGQSGTNTHR